MTALQLLAVMKRKQKRLSALGSVVHILPQVLVNARVAEEKKHGYEDDAEIAAAIQALEQSMAGKRRVLIRTSGTEPLVRVMLEGEDRAFIESEAVRLAKLIETKLA